MKCVHWGVLIQIMKAFGGLASQDLKLWDVSQRKLYALGWLD
jgi:hypothetical protein